jgi:Domain of unknown function (DUF1707)
MSAATPSRLPWDEFTLDPRRPDAAALRASDSDREVVHRVLADGYAEGRLTKDEHDERTSRAGAAKTLGELPPIIADLVPSVRRSAPADLHAQAVESWQSQRRQALLGLFLGPSLVCWAIWVFLAVDDGWNPAFPWPIFVSFFALMRVGQLTVNKREVIAHEQAKLEKRELKALGKRRDGNPPTG